MEVHYLYKITNLINGKMYIGQTKHPSNRWYAHKWQAVNKPIQIIHLAMAKYGIENFSYEIIAASKDQDSINEAEIICIEQYNCTAGNNGYNYERGGKNRPKSEEWKKKISEMRRGHFVSEETKNKISKSNKGKHFIGHKFSDQARKKMSLAAKGRPKSKEHRRKMSEAAKNRKKR